jgi:proteasome lid subunit RPN8/RPN11
MATLQLLEAVRAQLQSVVRAGYPNETCGLLLGRAGTGRVRVHEAVAAENLNRERPGDRYELDPRGHLRAEERARALGLEVVGVWHSHPDHPARPSETDRNGAWEGWSYLILSVTAEGVPELRSWRLRGERFEEEDLER